MYSLFRKNSNFNSCKLHFIDPDKLILHRGSNFWVFHKTNCVKSFRNYEFKDRYVAIRHVPTKHITKHYLDYPLSVVSLGENGEFSSGNMVLRNDNCDSLFVRNGAFNNLNFNHFHAVPSLHKNYDRGLLCLVPNVDKYNIYINTSRSLRQVDSVLPGPEPDTLSGMCALRKRENTHVYFHMRGVNGGECSVDAYILSESHGWVGKTNLFGVPFAPSTAGLHAVKVMEDGELKIYVFVGADKITDTTKTVYNCEYNLGGRNRGFRGIKVRIISHPMFSNRNTAVSVCPVNKVPVIYKGETGRFLTYSTIKGFTSFNFAEQVKKQVLANIYKQLVKQRGILSSGQSKIVFDTKVSKPAQKALKSSIKSRAFGDSLEITITKLDNGKICIKLQNKKKKINHEFVVTQEIWDKAFIYKEKRSIISAEAPILKFLRMVQGTEIKPENNKDYSEKLKDAVKNLYGNKKGYDPIFERR